MNREKSKNKMSPLIRSRIIRLILRSLPFPLAGPEIYDLISGIRESQSNIGKQVEETIEYLRSSSKLVSSLEKAVEERSCKLAELEKKYEHYSSITNAKADEVEAILKEIESSLQEGQKKERFVALGLNLLAGLLVFIAGALFGNSLVTLIKNLIF